MSYSQLGQDLNVVKFYKQKRDGYFIEIGASDGITLSNTYLLEKEYGWKGICAEPLPKQFIKLKELRTNSICVNKAVYNVSNVQLSFDIAENCDMLSGLSGHIGGFHKHKVDSNKTVINVNTITLNDLLEESKAPTFIEYMSLDTEGSELEILKSVDHSKYTFGLIDVEHNYLEPARQNIRNYLLSNGYAYIGANQWDDCYMHKSLLLQ